MIEQDRLDLEGVRYLGARLKGIFVLKSENARLAERLTALEEENARLKQRISELEALHKDDTVYVAYSKDIE